MRKSPALFKPLQCCIEEFGIGRLDQCRTHDNGNTVVGRLELTEQQILEFGLTAFLNTDALLVKDLHSPVLVFVQGEILHQALSQLQAVLRPIHRQRFGERFHLVFLAQFGQLALNPFHFPFEFNSAPLSSFFLNVRLNLRHIKEQQCSNDSGDDDKQDYLHH